MLTNAAFMLIVLTKFSTADMEIVEFKNYSSCNETAKIMYKREKDLKSHNILDISCYEKESPAVSIY